MRLALTYLAAAFVLGCAATLPSGIELRSPQVSLADIRLTQMGLFEQRYQLDLRIRNPNAVTLPIVGMHYTLLLNGGEFARGVSGRALEVAPYGEAVIAVDVIGGTGETLQQLARLARGQSAGLAYGLTGALRLRGRDAELPFTAGGAIRASSGREGAGRP